MTPRFLSKDRIIWIGVWMCLGFCLIIIVGYGIRLVSGNRIGLDQIAAIAGVISLPGSLIASAIGWMKGQIQDVREEIKEELQALKESVASCEQLIDATIVKQNTHERIEGHPGALRALNELRGTVLRTEAQVEVFGRFQRVYEQQTKLAEAIAYLEGLIGDGKSNAN